MEVLIENIEREFIYLWYYFSVQFQQIFKYWLFGMLLGSAISVFGKEKIQKMFLALSKKKFSGKNIGILRIIPASILGIASPLCMYGTIPIAANFSASFAEKEMEEDTFSNESMLAAFMMSSILLNPQLLFYSAALGMPMLVIRIVSCFLCGITAGLLVNFFYKKKRFFNFSKFILNNSNNKNHVDSNKNCEHKHCSSYRRYALIAYCLLFLKSFGRNIKATGLYFLIGIALSALFQRYVPQESFVSLFGGNRGFGLLMAATIGVPLYVCGGGTIPLLQTWLQNGMSMGSAAAFMITGPAAKITNLGALKIVLGIKHFFIYIMFAVLFALLCGLLVNVVVMVR